MWISSRADNQINWRQILSKQVPLNRLGIDVRFAVAGFARDLAHRLQHFIGPVVDQEKIEVSFCIPSCRRYRFLYSPPNRHRKLLPPTTENINPRLPLMNLRVSRQPRKFPMPVRREI